jgi:hypothetical protein
MQQNGVAANVTIENCGFEKPIKYLLDSAEKRSSFLGRAGRVPTLGVEARVTLQPLSSQPFCAA